MTAKSDNHTKIKVSAKLKIIRFAPLVLGVIVLILSLVSVTYLKLTAKKQSAGINVPDDNRVNSDYKSGDNFGRLPEWFPEYFPIPPDSIIVNSFQTEDVASRAVSVIWETNSDLTKIRSFYDEEFKRLGWAYNIAKNDPASFTGSFKKENIQGFLGVTMGENLKYVLSITLSVRK